MKRFLDCIVSCFLIIVLLPIWVIAYLVIRFHFGAPVIFKQERTGLHMRTFTIYKYRTMKDLVDSQGELLPDELRLTKVGSWLRKLSIDELPQLWNILKGDMSLVGPRPLLVQYNPYYTEVERRRFLVRPGITGLAQVSGRNLLHWDKRLELDVNYVDHKSLWLDFKIIVRTVINVLRRKDIVVAPGLVLQDMDVERGFLKG